LSVDAARNAFQSNGFWPHLTIDPTGEKVVQHLPLDSSSFALKWGSDHNAIQIEIVAYPDETPQFTSKQLTFILDVMQQVEGVVPIRTVRASSSSIGRMPKSWTTPRTV
jgi:hypothetical protein